VTAWILAIGRMLGLGSIAGIRPSLTLAVIGMVSYFDWGVETNSTFSWLNHWLVIGTFVVLAILESTFDKISKLDRLQDRLIMPYRMFMGGVAGAATIPFGWKGIVVGAAVGAGAAWFAQYTKHLSRPKSVPSPAVVSLISTGEELGALFGSVLVLAVPYFGYACFGTTGFIYWRMRGRRRSKYRKMRQTAVGRAAAAGAAGPPPDGQAAGPPPVRAEQLAFPELTALEAGAEPSAASLDEPAPGPQGPPAGGGADE
jgi:uncharacterized membrane protein